MPAVFIRPKLTKVWPCIGKVLHWLSMGWKMSLVLELYNWVCPRSLGAGIGRGANQAWVKLEGVVPTSKCTILSLTSLEFCSFTPQPRQLTPQQCRSSRMAWQGIWMMGLLLSPRPGPYRGACSTQEWWHQYFLLFCLWFFLIFSF